MFDRAMPLLFVGIWATGFIVARLIAPHADPMLFLTMRHACSAAVFAGIALAAGAAWPRTAVGLRGALISGVLMQAIYLGGVFWSVRHGLPAGIAALITGLQPLLTGALSWPLLQERVTGRQWMGIGIGFVGVVFVLGVPHGGALPILPVLVCLGSMLAITFGTIWQKRLPDAADLRTNAALQFAAAFVVTAPLALLEGGRFDGAAPAWAGLGWAVLVLSVGGISLLLRLIRRGAVARVTSLFYLVPPVSAAMAWVLFQEALTAWQVLGMALASAGVALARR